VILVYSDGSFEELSPSDQNKQVWSLSDSGSGSTEVQIDDPISYVAPSGLCGYSLLDPQWVSPIVY
jgi:hypothetical protein